MIDQLSSEMQRRLRARGLHAHCLYGTERLERAMPMPGTIEVEWNDGPEQFGPSGTTRALPSTLGQMQATSVASAEVRAASSKAGATHADHRRLTRSVVDMLVLEARSWLYTRGCVLTGARGAFVDVADSQQPHGATYELDLDIARGVQAPLVEQLDGALVDGALGELVGSGVVRVTVGDQVGSVCEPPAPGDEEEEF